MDLHPPVHMCASTADVCKQHTHPTCTQYTRAAPNAHVHTRNTRVCLYERTHMDAHTRAAALDAEVATLKNCENASPTDGGRVK